MGGNETGAEDVAGLFDGPTVVDRLLPLVVEFVSFGFGALPQALPYSSVDVPQVTSQFTDAGERDGDGRVPTDLHVVEFHEAIRSEHLSDDHHRGRLH